MSQYAVQLPRRACLAATAMLLCSDGWAASVARFVDPLDATALPTAHAARTLLQGIGWAGKRLVSVGARGTIIRSDDHGRTWQQASVPVQSDLLAVHFPTPLLGWAVGHGGVVLHTQDGGQRWARQLDGRVSSVMMPKHYAAAAAKGDAGAVQALQDLKLNFEAGADKPWLDVWFDNAWQGFAVGAFGMLMATHDGGAHWVPWLDRIDNPLGLHLNAIRGGSDGAVYIAAEQGLVFKLDRQKQRFVAMATGYSGSFFGLSLHGKNVLAFGLRGTVYASADSGAHWRAVQNSESDTWFASSLLPDGRIVLMGSSKKLGVLSFDSKPLQLLEHGLPTPLTGGVALSNTQLTLTSAQGVQHFSLPVR